MPEGVDLYGLYNKVTDWNAVRAAGIEFAWIKLSDGNTNRDDYGYVARGRGAGIVMGGYHYAQPGDPVAQANRLLDRCAAYGALDLAPALDLEDPFVPGPAAAAFAIAFLLQVEARGHVPCLYANQSMLLGILPAVRKAVPNVRVWGARYGAALTMSHDVHQYSSKGRVPGITGDVDRNRGPILRNAPTRPIEPEEDDDMTSQPYPWKLDASTKNDKGELSWIDRTLPWNGRAGVLNVISDGAVIEFSHKPWNWSPGGGVGGGDDVGDPTPQTIEVNDPGAYTIPAGTTRIFISYSSATPVHVWPFAS